jgi:hypothetical protein
LLFITEVHMKELRELTTPEKNLARKVFLETIPYNRVKISNQLGMNDCPWMQEDSSVFILNMGPLAFPDVTVSTAMPHNGKTVKQVFVHELTHVWQAFNEDKWVFTRSLAGVICTLGGAFGDNYDTSKGLKEGWGWDDFSVEQQASLVDQWFKGGMLRTGPRWHYIDNVIQKRRRIFKPMEFKGIWDVTTNGKTYCYWLKDHENCRWYATKPGMLTNYAPYDGKGDWEVKGRRLKIKWDSGSTETWNLPIAKQAPTGKWVTSQGASHPLTAKLTQKL